MNIKAEIRKKYSGKNRNSIFNDLKKFEYELNKEIRRHKHKMTWLLQHHNIPLTTENPNKFMPEDDNNQFLMHKQMLKDAEAFGEEIKRENEDCRGCGVCENCLAEQALSENGKTWLPKD
jgi:hypothetical protein